MATVRKRGKGYEVRVNIGRDLQGKRIVRSIMYYPDNDLTPKQLEKELERIKVRMEDFLKNGEQFDGNMTFQQLAQKWTEEYARTNLSHKSYSRAQDHLKRINKAIGHMKLKDIRPLHLNSFYKTLEAYGMNRDRYGNILRDGYLAPKTRLDHHRIISTILSRAVKWQIIDKNIAFQADPPKLQYREMSYLNEKDSLRMIKLLNDEPIKFKTATLLLIYTGMRRGELCGLEWKDIDLTNKTLHIVRTSQYIGNNTIITKEPKTRSSVREFTLSDSICSLLVEYREWQESERIRSGDRWIECDRLFTKYNGKPINPDSISGWFAGFIIRHELPKVTLHSLRHTNATLMIAEGIDICTVSRRLGHANTSTTLNVYAHALRSKDTVAAEKLESILNKTE